MQFRRTEPRFTERGSAVVDFVLITALLTFLFLAAVQVGFALHVRNTLISCAAEGARYGARLGSSPQRGVERTRELITTAISPRCAQNVTARQVVLGDGVTVVRIQVQAPVPVIGVVGVGQVIHATGRAFLEGQ